MEGVSQNNKETKGSDLFTPPGRNKLFSEVYDAICARVREEGNLDQLVTNFQEMRTDLQRVAFIYQLRELEHLSIVREESLKDSKEAVRMEQIYDSLIVNEQNAEEALASISRSIRLSLAEDLDPLAVRYMKRGWAFLLLKRFENAQKDASYSLSINPSCGTNLWNAFEILGHCQAKLNEQKGAEYSFKRALEELRKSEESNGVKAKAAGRISVVLKRIKAHKRNKGSKNIQTKSESKMSLPPLANGAHSVFRSASSNVKVVIDGVKGRSVVANKEFLPGDVIIVENPSSAALSTSSHDSHCANCFARLQAPRPCPNCATEWFCGDECISLSHNIHKFECPVIHLLNDEDVGKLGNLVFRIIAKQKWEDLRSRKEQLIEEMRDEQIMYLEGEHLENTEPAKVWKWKGGKSYTSDEYSSTFHLQTNSHKRSFGDLFKRSIAALYIAHCLKCADFFGSDDVNVEDLLFVASLAMRHLQSSSCNAYEMSEFVEGSQGVIDGMLYEFGGAIYPTVSLTNHSCWPNTVRYCVGSTCIVRAIRTIPKGGEILDNYGYHFSNTNIIQRKAALSNQYKFECQCEACCGEWPEFPHRQERLIFLCPDPACRRPSTYMERQKGLCTLCGNNKDYNELMLKIKRELENFEKAIQCMRKGDIQLALKALKAHQIFLDVHSSPPLRHCTEAQRAFRHCLVTLGNFIKREV